MAIFAGTAIRLIYKRAAFSPQFGAACTFFLMGVLTLFPRMTYSENRPYALSLKTQVFLCLAAAIFCIAALYMKRPKLRPEYPPVRWNLLSRRMWLMGFCAICVADPIVSFLLHGRVGLVQGNEGMGSGGGAHSDVFTPLTFVAWSCASMAMAMLMTDFLFSFKGIIPYIHLRIIDIGLVGVCSLCTALSGNRFVLICQLASLTIGLALFSRLKVWMVVTVAVFLAVFFVVVGNFRFGTIDITDSLQHTTGVRSVDTIDAWASTYSEPTFPNLDNFLRDQPGMMFGLDWVTTVVPSEIIDAVGLDRTNSSQWFADNALYAYHGLTFRTMYPDLIMDFGIKGALFLSAVFLWFGMRVYNGALQSPYHFVLFLAYSPLILLMPLSAGFYSLPNLLTFAIVLIIQKRPVVARKASLLELSRAAVRGEALPAQVAFRTPPPANSSAVHSA